MIGHRERRIKDDTIFAEEIGENLMMALDGIRRLGSEILGS